MSDSGEFYQDPGYYEQKFQCALEDLDLSSLDIIYVLVNSWLVKHLATPQITNGAKEEVVELLKEQIQSCKELLQSIDVN